MTGNAAEKEWPWACEECLADDDGRAVLRSLDYLEALEGMSPEALEDERARVHKAYQAGDAEAPVHLMLLHAHPNDAIRRGAAELPVPPLADSRTTPLLRFLRLLRAHAERERDLDARLGLLKRRNEQLEGQLRELKSIEETIQRRGASLPEKP